MNATFPSSLPIDLLLVRSPADSLPQLPSERDCAAAPRHLVQKRRLVRRGWIFADGKIKGAGVVADEDPPLAGPHPVEDDRGGLGRREWRVVEERLRLLQQAGAQVL